MCSWWELNNLQEVTKMSIGTGPDCYTGINKEEDKAVKLAEKINDWWEYELTPKEKYRIYCDENNIDY